MPEKVGYEVELSDNALRDQLNMSFEKDRYAIKTLISLINLGKDDFEGQRKLARAIFDTSTFETAFRMASNDDFRLVSQKPRAVLPPQEDENNA